MKHSIVRALHYMRNREVVMVLEAAYMIDKDRPEVEQLKNLFKPKPDDTDCSSCHLCDGVNIVEKGKPTEDSSKKQEEK